MRLFDPRFHPKSCESEPVEDVPGGRLAPSVTVDDANRIYLVGGKAALNTSLMGAALNDVWRLDTFKEVVT